MLHSSETNDMKGVLRTTGTLRKKTQIFATIFLVLTITVLWFLNSSVGLLSSRNSTDISKLQNVLSSHILKFTNRVNSLDEFKSMCYDGKQPTNIEDLIPFVNFLKNSKSKFCRHHYSLFSLVYQIRQKYTSIQISSVFMLKISGWLKGDSKLIEAAKNQSIIFLDNLFSQESVVFNPVRANRPGTGEGDVESYVNNLIKKTADSCDFCRFKNSTAADVFGYMESEYSVVISNTFKIDRFHGMVLLRSHDPVHFNQLQYIDSIYNALKWFQRVYQIAPSHQYRFMYTDMLPKASASQVHPHTHLTLGNSQYYAKWNILHRASRTFATQHDSENYWNVLLKIHSALGLSVSFGKASVIAYLTPQKDFEVVVIAEKPCLDFFRLVFFTVRTFIDDLGQYALSMGYVYPKLSTNYAYGDELPMMVRIVSRGPADSTRSDISSFDLFGTANVNKDPFKVIQSIRNSVNKRSKEEFSYPSWTDFE